MLATLDSRINRALNPLIRGLEALVGRSSAEVGRILISIGIVGHSAATLLKYQAGVESGVMNALFIVGLDLWFLLYARRASEALESDSDALPREVETLLWARRVTNITIPLSAAMAVMVTPSLVTDTVVNPAQYWMAFTAQMIANAVVLLGLHALTMRRKRRQSVFARILERLSSRQLATSPVRN